METWNLYDLDANFPFVCGTEAGFREQTGRAPTLKEYLLLAFWDTVNITREKIKAHLADGKVRTRRSLDISLRISMRILRRKLKENFKDSKMPWCNPFDMALYQLLSVGMLTIAEKRENKNGTTTVFFRKPLPGDPVSIVTDAWKPTDGTFRFGATPEFIQPEVSHVG